MSLDEERTFSIGYTARIKGMVTLSKDKEYFNERLCDRQNEVQIASRIFETRLEGEITRALNSLDKTYDYEWDLEIDLKP